MRMVTLDGDSMGETGGPTLPEDFPAHLLLRICDAILAPLLTPSLPLKPYSKPWSKSEPPSWESKESTAARPTTIYGRSSAWTGVSKASGLGNCKNDLLAFAYGNKRLWSICGVAIYRHVRVTNLAVGDVLVSRRNLLKHTKVLEIYITREVEASQAQTDLNLSRLFIQAGIILLWCPSLHTVLLDIKSVPSDQHIWSSFLSRVRQRLFIDKVPGLSSTRDSPRMPVTSLANTIAAAGNERSTSRDQNARWGDSQGLINSPDRVSIPNFAMGMGYTSAGEVERGFGGVLDTLFSHQFPTSPHASRVQSPSLIIGGTMVKYPSSRRLDALTSLDLLIPRPSWGHEESEGFALGLTLRRLRGLKRLGLHADGVIQNNQSNYVGFGLKRQPPFGTVTDPEDESEEEADIAVDASGVTIYPQRSNSQIDNNKTGPPSGISAQITGSRHEGYGPETWWAGVLNALTYAQSELEDPENVYPLCEQSIEEFRISVSVPGGNVDPSDFDAFFYLVLPYLQKMTELETLVFDMVFPLPQDQSYQSWPNEGHFVGLYDRQRHYVEKLVDPAVPSNPLGPEKLFLPRHRSESEPMTITPSTPHAHPRVHPSDAILTIHQEPSKSVKYVFFGDYRGLPYLPPPNSPEGPVILSPNPSPVVLSTATTTTPAPLESVKENTTPEPKSKSPFGNGIKERPGKGTKGIDKDASHGAIGSVNMEHQRVTPGMWWSVKRMGGFNDSALFTDNGDVVVVQGWEELSN